MNHLPQLPNFWGASSYVLEQVMILEFVHLECLTKLCFA